MPKVIDLKLRQRPSIALAIPTAEFIPRVAFKAMLELVAHCFKPGDEIIPIDRIATIALARNMLVEQFLALPESVQFLIMLDADMVPPANLIDIWVGREDYRFPFISGYCTRKYYPYQPTPSMHRGTATRHGEVVHVYDPISDIAVNSGVHRVDGVGAAAICIRRDVLAAIEPPWFSFDGGGEDYYFCRKVQQVTTPDAPDGVWIAVDSHVEIGHAAEHIAYPRDYFAVKDTWIAETGREEVVLERATG